MIGLAMRAGKVASGAFQVNKALEEGKACLILVDRGISESTLEQYKGMCKKNGIIIELLEEGELAQSIGKPDRMSAAILDENFSNKIKDMIHN